MEIGSQRRDGEVSRCRSLGSNCHPSSQSRKISIGVLADSSKTKPKTTIEGDAIAAVGQQISNSQNNSMRNGRLNGVKAQCENKNPSALERTSSPWVSTRFFQQELHTSTALHAKENTHIPAASGGSYSRSSTAKEARVTVTQTAKVNQKGYSVAQRETVELSFANVHEVRTPVKEMIEDKTNKTVTGSTEGLRMKLMEILGATSSPIKPVSEFRSPDMNECNLQDKQSQPVMQPIQDSDTIEKDSEDPDYTTKRPVTRSLLRKADSIKVPESKTGSGSHFTRKRKNQEKNASPFVDGLSRQQDGTSRGGSKSLGRNMGKKSLKIESNKSLFNAQCETRQTANGSKLKTPAEKISSFGNKIATSHNLPSEKKDNVGEPYTLHRDDASLESPLRNKRDQTSFDAQCKATKTRKTANESKLKAPAEKISFHGNKTVTSHNLPSEKKGNVGEPDTRHWHDASLDSPPRNKRDQTLFNAQCKATKTRKTANESKLKAPTEKISFHGNKTVTSHNVPSEKKGNVGEPDTRHRDDSSLESPLRNKSDQTCDISCPYVDEPDTRHRDDASPQSSLRTKRDQTNDISYRARESTQQEEFFDPSLKNIVESTPVFHIPTNGTRPSFADSPLGSPVKDTHGNADHTGNAEQFDSGKFHGFVSFLSPAPYHCKKRVEAETEAEAEADLSDDGEEHEAYHFTPWNFTTEDKDATKLPEQSSEETHSDNSPEVSANEDEETEHESPEIANVKEASFTLHRNKKFRSQEGSEVNELSPFADSLKGTEQSNKFEEDSDQNNEDALETVVTILSLALERIEKKIKAATAKKSADIISAAAQEIRVQLQTTDSHIQKDMGKLINIAKLKRKSGEARLEEKQERVRVLYEKFKDDVNQHLQECNNIVSELGSQEAELKQVMEKQNVFHRKLIREAEEAVESQLKNADRRVTAVNKLAREKTLHLRNAIAAFLEEDDMN